MKARSLFLLVPILGSGLYSCTATRPMMDDDVYIMKAADVPLGEDLLDESSYATYKYRVNANVPTQGYYNQQNGSVLNSDPMFTLGSNWWAYGRWNNYGTLPYMSSAYWGMHRNGFYDIDGIPGIPGCGCNGFTGSGFYNSFCYYNSWTVPSVYYSPGGVFFTNGIPNSNGFNNINVPSNTLPYLASGNKVSGPRATLGGYYSGSNRGGSQQIKSHSNSNYQTESRPTQYTSRDARPRPEYSRTDANVRNTNGTINSRSIGTHTNSRVNSDEDFNSSRSNSTRGSYPSVQTRSSGSNENSGGRSSGSNSGGSSGASSGRSGGRGN